MMSSSAMMRPEEAGADTASLGLNATSHILYVPSYPLCPLILYVPPYSMSLHPSPLPPRAFPFTSKPLTPRPHPHPPNHSAPTPSPSPPSHKVQHDESSAMMRPGGEGADTASLRLNATKTLCPLTPHPSPLTPRSNIVT